MSYTDALSRVTELRDRLGLPATNISRVGNDNFDEVLATAKSRFNEGPTKIVDYSQNVGPGQRGTSPNVPASNVAPRIRPVGGRADAAVSTPGFATPAKVDGWSPQLKQMFDAASQRFGVPRELLIGVSRAESAFRSDVGSPAGARGLMQLMPATANGLGVTNITDPWQNLAGGAKYLRQLMDRFDGDVKKVLAGYNAGPGAVERFGGVPPYAETQTYVARVLDYAGELGWKP